MLMGVLETNSPKLACPLINQTNSSSCSSSRCLQGGLELSSVPRMRKQACLQGLWGEYLTTVPRQ